MLTTLWLDAVLKLTKAAQIQHGLRHGDYTRYRQYCAVRLTRLRRTLGFTHGKGRFVQKRLGPQHITQQKYDHHSVPLVPRVRHELKSYRFWPGSCCCR